MKTLEHNPEEVRRLEVLQSLHLDLGRAEAEFDDFTSVAAALCETPIALINFIDRDLVWPKSAHGRERSVIPRELALCPSLIQTGQPLIVEDLSRHPDCTLHARAYEEMGLKFYAGVPLVTDEREVVGTLCVLDRVPRKLGAPQLSALKTLGRQVMNLIRHRCAKATSSAETLQRCQKELAFERERFQLAISGPGAGLWDWDLELETFYFSPSWLAMLGYRERELAPEFAAWVKLVHPDDLAGVQAALDDFVSCRTPDFKHEHRLRTKCGAYRWVLARASAIRNERGDALRITGWHIDNHEAKMQADALREKTDILDMITTHVDDVIWMTDPNKFASFFVSSAYERIWGRTVESLRANPKSFIDAIHPDDLERVRKAMAKQTEGAYDEVYRVVTPDGLVRWVHDRSSVIRKDDGSALRVVGIATDITANRLRETELHEQKEKFQSIVDNIPILLATVNETGVHEWVNQAWRKGLGWDVESMAGRDMFAEFYPDLESRQKALDFVSSKGGFWQEFDVRTRSGRIMNLNWFKLRLSSGRTLCIAQDITERKKAEMVIHEQNAKIASSAKLSALGEMAGGIAHEINNPLAIILGRVTILQEMIESGDFSREKLKTNFAKISSTVERIAKIIKGLRSCTRNGDNDPFEPVLIEQVITDTLELCREKMRHHGVELVLSPIPEGLLECRATQISQVLLNLISNAHDAVNGKPGAWVRIDSRIDGEILELAVTDNGTGIPPALQGRIMEPFFTTKEVGKGTGLGLSISRGIVDDHAGSLEYDAASRHTRFVVRLPLQQRKCATLSTGDAA